MRITFGALCPKLKDQLNCNNADIKDFQILADSITRLKIRRFINQSASEKAYQKLANQIIDYMGNLNEETE